MSRKRRSFTTEYKVEAARRVIDSGRTIAEVARRGDDGGFLSVAFDDEFVEVAGFGGIEWAQGEVVDDQDLDGGQPPDLGVDGVVESRCSQSREQFVRPCEQDTVASADCHVPQRCCQMCFADSGRYLWVGSERWFVCGSGCRFD